VSTCRGAGKGDVLCCIFSRQPTAPRVWVNDVEVMSHEGGYTPFEADISDHVTPGQEVRITALIDNTLHWQSIPPGVIEDTPAGRRQRYWHDFFNYAGIHRNVWLYATDSA
jgi:beta-glucuronidase